MNSYIKDVVSNLKQASKGFRRWHHHYGECDECKEHYNADDDDDVLSPSEAVSRAAHDLDKLIQYVESHDNTNEEISDAYIEEHHNHGYWEGFKHGMNKGYNNRLKDDAKNICTCPMCISMKDK